MKSKTGIQIILFFLAFSIGSFDRHLVYYCPGGLALLIASDTIPSHSEFPVKSFDNHEDITVKPNSCTIPDPVELPVRNFLIFHRSFRVLSPHTVWQPPESKA
jgi:hypothetical protein